MNLSILVIIHMTECLYTSYSNECLCTHKSKDLLLLLSILLFVWSYNVLWYQSIMFNDVGTNSLNFDNNCFENADIKIKFIFTS